MSCCDASSNGQSTPALPPVFEQDSIVASWNFPSIAQALGTGSHNLASEQGPAPPFTVLNQATLDITAAGLRYRANATNTLFTSVVATRTAANLQLLWGDFYSAFDVDASRTYLVALYCTLLALPTAQASPAGLQLGIVRPANTPSGAAVGYRAMKRNNAAGAQALNTMQDGAGDSDSYTNPLPNVPGPGETKCFAMLVSPGGLSFMAGDYDTATQTWDQVRFRRQVASIIATSVAGSIWQDQGSSLVIAFPTGNTNADMQIDAQRLVISSPR